MPIAPQLRSAARDSTLVAVLGSLDDASVQAIADSRARGSAAPAFAILLDAVTWARSAERQVDSSPLRTKRDATTENIAETLRAAGWWVAVARSGDSIAATYSRLLRQRAFATGSHAWAAPATSDERVVL
jgi:hypothetical protein